jgi:hypothetical protein
MTQLYPLMSAAREFKQLVRSVGDDQLAARTPCTKYDVCALVNHLLYWGPWLEAAARKEPPPTETRGEDGRWRTACVDGRRVFGEFVVHSWDLAKATGRPWACDEDVADAATAGMAEQGRQIGIFGPEVPVPASAPALDRLAGLTGRDPDWTP